MYDAVGGILLESVDDLEEDIRVFCQTLYFMLIGTEGQVEEVGELEGRSEGARLLEAPVQLATKLKIEGNC